MKGCCDPLNTEPSMRVKVKLQAEWDLFSIERYANDQYDPDQLSEVNQLLSLSQPDAISLD
jgi:hypothetical protein